jgi:hypothetical protein
MEGVIRSYSQAAADAIDSTDVRHVVSRLCYDNLDPNGREHRVASRGTARLDRQGNPTGGGANLQVQLNDPQEHGLPRNTRTSIAQVVVPQTIFELANNCEERNVRTHLESVVRSALLKSSQSKGRSYVITSS